MSTQSQSNSRVEYKASDNRGRNALLGGTALGIVAQVSGLFTTFTEMFGTTGVYVLIGALALAAGAVVYVSSNNKFKGLLGGGLVATLTTYANQVIAFVTGNITIIAIGAAAILLAAGVFFYNRQN